MGVYDKMGSVTTATRSKAEELVKVADAKGFKLTRIWGMGDDGDEHPTGRALDLMIDGKGLGRAAGDFLAAYLWANRTRLRVKWIIWSRTIRSTTKGKPSTATHYTGENPHTDHVHVFFAEGAYVPPASGGGGGKVTDWWHVNPDKVSSFLWGLKGGKTRNVKAIPGRNIAIDHWKTDDRRTWGVTAQNNWFAKAYLSKGKRGS